MAWIKAKIDDDAHRDLKLESVERDVNLEDLIAGVLEDYANE